MGTLYFTNGNKMELPCGSSIYVVTGGKIASDGSGNSNIIKICGTTYYTGSQGTLNGPSCLPPSIQCAVPLPIELLYFKSSACDKSICLEWKTASERNNCYFTLEHSMDALSWLTIGEVDAGNINGRVYSFEHEFPEIGNNYYRLSQTDCDGQIKKFEIIEQDFNVIPDVIVFPNPSYGKVIVKARKEITVADLTGRIIFKGIPPGEIILNIPAGIYLCMVDNQTIKLIIQ